MRSINGPTRAASGTIRVIIGTERGILRGISGTMRDKLIASVSHDLRTPLNGIMGMTEIAKGNQDKPEVVHDCLEKISLASKHLLYILNEILDISAIDEGKAGVKNEPFDLKQVLDETLIVIEGYAFECNVQLINKFDDLKHTKLIGDEAKLRQILLNLLSNAVKFTPSGGKAELRVSERETGEAKSEYIFEIEDNGIGIDQKMQSELFEPFKKGENAVHKQFAGSGLGMAIVKNYIELMGGKITVKSEVNKGSLFTAVTEFEYDETEETKKLAEEAEEAGLIGMKVLIADDNLLNLEIMKELLEELGVEVTAVVDGVEALEAFSRSTYNYYDALLLDILMPALLGTEVSSMIRNFDCEDKNIPIIALTGRNEEAVINEARAAGMNDYILKPVSQKDIINVLRKYYKRGTEK